MRNDTKVFTGRITLFMKYLKDGYKTTYAV